MNLGVSDVRGTLLGVLVTRKSYYLEGYIPGPLVLVNSQVLSMPKA